MPIYEYECPKCGRFEVVQKVSDKPLTKDPECCRNDCPNKAERQISAAAFHLKGTGWYKTDYKSSGTAGTATSSSSSNQASSAPSDSSSDGDAGSSSSDTGSDAKGGNKKKKSLKTSGGGGGCGSGCGCH